MPNPPGKNLVIEELLRLLLCQKVNFSTIVKYVLYIFLFYCASKYYFLEKPSNFFKAVNIIKKQLTCLCAAFIQPSKVCPLNETKQRLPYFNSKSWVSLLLPTTEILHHYFSLYFGYYIYPYVSFKCSNNRCNSSTIPGLTSPQ